MWTSIMVTKQKHINNKIEQVRKERKIKDEAQAAWKDLTEKRGTENE